MSDCRVPMPNFKRDRMKETKSFRIEMKPVGITATCPYCEEEVRADIGEFIEEELWHDGESMECPECGREFMLVGPDPY